MPRSNAAVASALFFVVVPGIVAGVVPWLVTDWAAPIVAPYLSGLMIGIGGSIIAAGLILLVDSFIRFVTEGNGTPMPWMPTEGVVAGGGYRYVRNPMYLAVAAIILGQASLFGSLPLLAYCAAVWLVFHLFIILVEEPGLHRSFGSAYQAYIASVPRWLPRMPPPTSQG